jgi:hypothetical protein
MYNLKKKNAADRSKINMHEAWELNYWTIELGVSKDELQRLVRSTQAWRGRLTRLRREKL